MGVLIISLPRTGSSELGKRISSERGLRYEFEPYNQSNPNPPGFINFEKSVVKTIIFQIPKEVEEKNRIEWLIDLSKKFNETVLLSRRDLIACAESWSFLNYKTKTEGFKSNQEYFWEKTPNYDRSLSNLKKWDGELSEISEKLELPITYYEDIYDMSGPGRLRKGNRIDVKSKMI